MILTKANIPSAPGSLTCPQGVPRRDEPEVLGELNAVRRRAGWHEGAGASGLQRSAAARVGTIHKRYEVAEYTAFEVLFADGQSELFWDHQLKEAKESAFRSTLRRLFW
jgi:hypothetical protein